MGADTSCVITGVGIVSAAGCGGDAHWATLSAGAPAFSDVAVFDGLPPMPVGVVADLDLCHELPRRLTKRLDRFTVMAIVVTLQALADAALEVTAANREGLGLILGNSTGGWSFVEPQLYGLYRTGDLDAIDGYVATAWFPTAPQGEISILLGIGGFSKTVSAENLSVGFALEQAMAVLEEGRLRAVLVGGSEAPLSALVYSSLVAEGRISASGRFVPFHPEADGSLVGEGAAMLVVEDVGHARDRGARVLAAIDAIGFGGDLGESMASCLRCAGLPPAAVDYVVLDGRGAPDADRDEYAAIDAVFDHDVLVSAPKSMYGDLLGASMGADLVTACLALKRQVVPPSATAAAGPRRSPAGRHVAGLAEPAQIRHVLVNGRDNYGHCMSVLLSEPQIA